MWSLDECSFGRSLQYHVGNHALPNWIALCTSVQSCQAIAVMLSTQILVMNTIRRECSTILACNLISFEDALFLQPWYLSRDPAIERQKV